MSYRDECLPCPITSEYSFPRPMLPVLSDELRQAIVEDGTPLAIADDSAAKHYVLLEIELMPDGDLGAFTARVPGIGAYGEGQTKEEAALALMAALRGYMEVFGNEAGPA